MFKATNKIRFSALALSFGLLLQTPLVAHADFQESLTKAISTGTVSSTPTSNVYQFAPLPAEQMPVQSLATYNSVNPYKNLKVVTQITKIKDTYFIVDCYHNQVIYSNSLEKPLNEWRILTKDVSQPHTIASDGTVYLVDDTENNRVLVFQKKENYFQHIQTFPTIGNRPHAVIYDAETATFYVWSSTTGQMYLMRRNPSSNQVYLSEIRQIPELYGIYVRSFTIVGEQIIFPSGDNCAVLVVDKNTFEVQNRYPVSPNYSGMVQILPIQGAYYVTISTSLGGNQSYATLLRAPSLEALSQGQCEDIYHLFHTDGTPYYISQIGNTYYLTNHRSQKGIWSFHVSNGTISTIQTVY